MTNRKQKRAFPARPCVTGGEVTRPAVLNTTIALSIILHLVLHTNRSVSQHHQHTGKYRLFASVGLITSRISRIDFSHTPQVANIPRYAVIKLSSIATSSHESRQPRSLHCLDHIVFQPGFRKLVGLAARYRTYGWCSHGSKRLQMLPEAKRDHFITKAVRENGGRIKSLGEGVRIASSGG